MTIPPYPRRAVSLVCLVCVALVAAAGVSAAAESPAEPPWEEAFNPDVPAVLAAAQAVEVEPDAAVVVLLDEHTVRLADDGSRTVEVRRVYRIRSPAAVESWSQAVAEWQPWRSERPELRARVLTADGREIWLSPDTLVERVVGAGDPRVLGDQRELRGALPGVGVGSVVEVRWLLRDRAPRFGQGWSDREPVGRPVPVLRYRLVLDAPVESPLRYRARRLEAVEPRRDGHDGRQRLTFELGPLAPVAEPEPGLPGDLAPTPQLAYSTAESWSAASAGYAETVEAGLAAADVSAAGLPGAPPAADRTATAARVTRRLHELVRYTGLELGASAWIPADPAAVLQRGYGDCKDKSAVLVAMLRVAGVPAYVALVSTGPGQDVDPDLPGLDLFDHMLVYAPGDPELWIDATAPFTPVGSLPAPDQGRLALVIRPGGGPLVRLPEAPSSAVTDHIEQEIVLGDSRPGRTHHRERMTGSLADDMRAVAANLGREKFEASLSTQLRQAWGAEPIGLMAEGLDDPGAPLTITCEVENLPAIGLRDADLTIGLGVVLGKLPAWLRGGTADGGDPPPDEPRRDPLELPEAFRVERVVRVVPPPGYVPVDPPASRELEAGPAEIWLRVERGDDGSLVIDHGLDTIRRSFSPEEAAALRRGVDELRDNGVLHLRFRSLADSLTAAGELGEALAELRRLIAAQPDHAVHRLRMSRVVLTAGLGGAARQEAAGAVAIEETALTLANQGWVLLHDEVGRQLGPGADLAGAERALRRAVELDPADLGSRWMLARVLERGERSLRYGEGSRLDGAIDLYRGILADSPEQPLEGELLADLLHADRLEEAASLARESRATDDASVGLHLAAIAAAESPQDALREAAEQRDDSRRRNALVTAATILAGQRRYPAAAELAAAGARGATDAADALTLASTLRSTRRFEELEPTFEPPLRVFVRFLRGIMLGEEVALDELVVEDYAGEDGWTDEDRQSFVETFGDGLVPPAGFSPAGALDLFLSMSDARVEGDPAVGYRLQLRNAGESVFTVWVAGEASGYRIAAVRAVDLCARALGSLRAGKPAAARRWLGWAREEAPPAKDDDPLAGDAIVALLPAGEAWAPERMRLAATACLARRFGSERFDDVAAEGIALLEAVRSAGEWQAERATIEHALAEGYRAVERYDDLVAVGDELLERWPSSDEALRLLGRGLTELGRDDDVREIARRRLEQRPQDPAALQLLARLAELRGDLHESRIQLRRLTAGRGPSAWAYNQLAWQAIGSGELDEQAIADAQRAVSLEARYSTLHTLAAVYAELDRPSEARDVLLQAMAADDRAEPDFGDWYVLGRIAESYQLPEVATELYGRVEAGTDPPRAASIYAYAQRRLAGLAARRSR